MASLADHIESYIKQQIQRTPSQVVVLNRAQLAEAFSCVPSQINYVLATRFTRERGYVIESRRGGGGYIRVVKTLPGRSQEVAGFLKRIGSAIDEQQADHLLVTLIDHGVLERRQAQLIKGIIQQELNDFPQAADRLRASLLRAMLLVQLHEVEAKERR